MTGIKLIKTNLMRPMFDLLKEEGQYDGEEIICVDLDYESFMLKFVQTGSFTLFELKEFNENGERIIGLQVTFSSKELGRDLWLAYYPSTNMFNKLDVDEIPEKKKYYIHFDPDNLKSLVSKDYYMTVSNNSDDCLKTPSIEEQEIFCDEIFSKMCAFCAE